MFFRVSKSFVLTLLSVSAFAAQQQRTNAVARIQSHPPAQIKPTQGVPTSQTQPGQRSAPQATPILGPQPIPVAPPPPSTPEQGPSSPPQVSFQGGQLTIEARNSTMADVLNVVKQKTGAAVEMPMVSSERVVGRFGPGAPRDVMAQLLNGSHYDYVLLGSPADPGALKKIVLMARAAGPEPAPQQQASQPYQQNQNLPAVSDVDTDQGVTEENSSEVPPEVQQQQEEPQQPDQNLQQEQQQPGQNGPVVKTPEQLLRELQQQQQQQQQNQPPQ
jgi:hypothetical protein